jgi:hypothetical protein
VTLGCEPGGLASKKLQDAVNAVMSDPATPFRWYFLVDGKSITGVHYTACDGATDQPRRPDEDVGGSVEVLQQEAHPRIAR